jgi:phosphate acetyltransferase
MSHKHEKYQRLIDAAKALQPVTTAIVHPCDESSLSGAVDAAKLGLIRPILVGPKAKIQAVAAKLKLDIAG